ncbi:uncharacterized protein LOC128224732 [Mya arenaria]|uniref:uncharacterized protein LOC128224732 n=1 Tax=Mya arenaria TaxID=6604 RepID=UPI0022E54B83|nr:uncharacterized protein LOC128224732 [Mya arenaria]
MNVLKAWILPQVILGKSAVFEFEYPSNMTVLHATDDSKCTVLNGTCKETSSTCEGLYKPSLCAGHVNRQCCVASSTYDTIECTGNHRHHARGTAYYPDPSPEEGGYFDMRGFPLQTLQAYMKGMAPFVTVAMDSHPGIAYDTPVCIPELNRKYRKFIDFRVRDTGGAFQGKKFSRIDIYVRDRHDSYDGTINGPLTLFFR